MRNAIKFAFILLTMACAFMEAKPARAAVTQRCNWGVGALAPTASQWPLSTQVMMMPTVMDFGSPPFNRSQVAFITFENATQLNRDGGGVLRIIDGNCHEIARFPDLSLPPSALPLFCPASLNTVPDLGSTSGLAVGNLDNNTTDVEIIGVIGGPTANHKQIIAFNLVGPLTAARLVPRWCSPPLAGPDIIVRTSAPAIAQLDSPGNAAALKSEIIIDNKVFNFDGTLRYTGGVLGPRSRAVVVANPFGSPGFMPQVITGRGVYTSTIPFWTGTLGWVNLAVTNGSMVFPGVAELDSSFFGPEIVVVDTMAMTLRVLSAAGATLASIAIPSPGCNYGGGPPMIGNADGVGGPEIGVAGCSRYTLFKYSAGTLSVLWSRLTHDPSGQTTSTLYNTLNGARIYYADTDYLRVFNGIGTLIQIVPNSSATAIEGPVIASFDPASPANSTVIVGANNLWGGTYKGIRIFDDPALGPSRSFWNQHTYHATNVTNSFGAIPIVEPASWLIPARNTYRTQQWP